MPVPLPPRKRQLSRQTPDAYSRDFNCSSSYIQGVSGRVYKYCYSRKRYTELDNGAFWLYQDINLYMYRVGYPEMVDAVIEHYRKTFLVDDRNRKVKAWVGLTYPGIRYRKIVITPCLFIYRLDELVSPKPPEKKWFSLSSPDLFFLEPDVRLDSELARLDYSSFAQARQFLRKQKQQGDFIEGDYHCPQLLDCYYDLPEVI